MSDILLYHHGGSYNHGCEALVRTITSIIDDKLPNSTFAVASEAVSQDEQYIAGGDNISFFSAAELFGLDTNKRRMINSLYSRVTHHLPLSSLQYKKTVECAGKSDLIVSVGGDVYSYGRACAPTALDNLLRRRCARSVLWGCSINKNVLDAKTNKFKIDGLKDFTAIFARESITYENLKNAGLDNVFLYPDPAFTLDVSPTEPMFDNGRECVGINISPLIQGYETKRQATVDCYRELALYILKNTDWNVLFIPHVQWKGSEDLLSAREVVERLGAHDEKRVHIAPDSGCMEQKGRIASMKMFIAARTHASIAAYSSCVPTIAVGYSVKANGIARDIFGEFENYVVPVQKLESKGDLVDRFVWLCDNYDTIKAHMNTVMPGYIDRAAMAGGHVRKIIQEQ